MDKYQPDILILVETWLEEQLKLEGSEYEIIQNESHTNRGVAVIYRNVEIKKEVEQFNFKLVCSIRDKNRVKAYIDLNQNEPGFELSSHLILFSFSFWLFSKLNGTKKIAKS